MLSSVLTWTFDVDVTDHRFTAAATSRVDVWADDANDAALTAAQIVGATHPDFMVTATRLVDVTV